MKGTVTFNSISEDNTGYKLAFWQENKMHLVQVAKKPTQRGKVRQLEHQLFWSSPEPLTLTREPWHCIPAEGRQSSAGPTSRAIHPLQAAAE